MKKLLFILLVLPIMSSAQKNLDSLLGVWQDPTQRDSVRVEAYKDYIQRGFLDTNPDSALMLVEALHIYAKKHNYPRAASTGFNLQGRIYFNHSKYLKALEFHEKSLAIRVEIGDKGGIAASLNNIGIIYYYQGKYPRALEYYERSLAIQEELDNKQGIANTLNNIGNIYLSQVNDPYALDYYERSLTIREEIGDKYDIAASLNNIGLIYKEQGNHPRALEYLEKALTINEELGIKQRTAINLYNIGDIYNRQGKTSRALEYHEKSLAIKEEIGDLHGIAGSLNYIGFIYKNQGSLPLALDYCYKSLALLEEIGALDGQKEALQCLYDTYKAMGKGNEALEYLEKLRVVEYSLNVQETTKKLEQMEFAKVMLQDSLAKVEEARLVQEAHKEEVRKKNQIRNVFIGSSLFLLLFAGGFYSRWRYVRKSRDTISKEKDRSENLLLNILPLEIAAELKEKGRADARDFEMVSILFTDFKGFTETSAKLSAAELVHEINYCFEGFDGIIEKYGVEKIKTIGDAYMAAGGLPVQTDDSVKNTVFAALEMQAFIQKRKSENEAAGKPAFEMRVGIHTGPVVAGIVGVKKFQYDVWGDTVNTASRMESSGEAGKVNISQSTFDQLKEDPNFAFESRGKIEAKGKGEIEMWFVDLKPEI